MGRTCGGADEIGLAAMGVKLNGLRRVPLALGERERELLPGEGHGAVPALLAGESGHFFRVGIFLGFASSSTRTPHAGPQYAQVSGRNRTGPQLAWN